MQELDTTRKVNKLWANNQTPPQGVLRMAEIPTGKDEDFLIFRVTCNSHCLSLPQQQLEYFSNRLFQECEPTPYCSCQCHHLANSE